MRDLAVTLTCLLMAAGMLASQTGATRDLSKVQACTNNLRQLYTGLTAYVNQYNCYPPNNPYPTYMSNRTINGISTNGFDPNIGWIMTYGLGLTPPATDTQGLGHFIWFGTALDDLPDVCKCPAISQTLLELNPEIDANAVETFVSPYALSYMTSGTCRAATRLIQKQSGALQGMGGRNPPIPDPTSGGLTARPYDNAQGGPPYVWVKQHATGAAPDENAEGQEVVCWIQAINPAEVQSPGRVFYLADSRDYRPVPGGWPRAGQNSGWGAGYANRIFTSARHFGYGNVLYLDGHVTRDGQVHEPQWNMGYDGQQAPSTQWRVATFDANLGLARIATQVRTMPVLMVKGWEYFFDASGVKAQ